MNRLMLRCKLGNTLGTSGIRPRSWVDAQGDRIRFNLDAINNQPVLVYRTATATIPDRLTISAEVVVDYPHPHLKISAQDVTVTLTSAINPLDMITNPAEFWIKPDLVTEQIVIVGEANWQQWMDQFIERRNNYPEQDDMVPLTMLDLVQNRDYHNYVG